MNKLLQIFFLVFACVLIVGCRNAQCQTDGVIHSCSFSPSSSQIQIMKNGKEELNALFYDIPKPPPLFIYDTYNHIPFKNGQFNLSGNFEGHKNNLTSGYYSEKYPTDICLLYKKYFDVKSSFEKYSSTSCEDRSFDDGHPVYVVNYTKNVGTTFTSVFIRIRNGPATPKNGKKWNSTVEINLYFTEKKGAKKCFRGSGNYTNYCESSNWVLATIK